MTGTASGKDEAPEPCVLIGCPSRKDGPILPTGNFPDKLVIDQACDDWILASFFFVFSFLSTLMDFVLVHKNAKTTCLISSHIDRTGLVNNTDM